MYCKKLKCFVHSYFILFKYISSIKNDKYEYTSHIGITAINKRFTYF